MGGWMDSNENFQRERERATRQGHVWNDPQHAHWYSILEDSERRRAAIILDTGNLNVVDIGVMVTMNYK